MRPLVCFVRHLPGERETYLMELRYRESADGSGLAESSMEPRMRTTAPLFAFLLAGSVAYADQTSSSTQITFDSIDRNSDRRISRTEAGYHKELIDRFALIDTDGDGFISREELYANFTASRTRSTGGH